MLQKIHDKVSGWFAGFLLLLLAVVFVFWGIDFGFSTARYAAKVKATGQPFWQPAQKIGVEQVRNAWQNQLTQFQQMYRSQVPEDLQKSLQNRLLEDFIRNEVMTQHTDTLGYRVSDAEVLKAYEATPNFQIDGKYSKDRALYILQSQGIAPAAFEAEQRRYMQVGQLQGALMQSAFVTPTELADHRRLQSEQREASWLVIPVGPFIDGAKPEAAEIQKYYDEHKDSFMTAETVALRYVELKLADVAAGVPVTEENLRAHYDGAKDSYKSEDGKQKTFEEARAAVETDYRTREAEKRFGELQEQLADKSFENLNDLDKVAQDLTLRVQEISDFRRDVGGGDIGARPEVIEAAFSESVLNGENSRPLELAPGHVIVVRVSAHRPAEPKPLTEVRESIVATLKKEKAEQQVRDLVQRSAALMQAGGEDLQRLAAEFKTQPQGPKFVSRTDGDLPVEVRNALFATPHPETGKAFYRAIGLGNGDGAVLKFSAVRKDTTEETAEQVKARREQLRQQQAQTEFGAYMTDVRRDAKVTVNPKVFE